MAKLSLLRAWFDEFNKRYFGGELESIPIRITRSRKYDGKLAYRETEAGIRSNYAIYIASGQSLDDARDTLLHEMVHQYLFAKNIIEAEEHGPEFRKLACQFGLKLSED